MTGEVHIPSWMRWPPNCCETCVWWNKTGEWIGKCQKADMFELSTVTDARFRCPTFQRKAGV